MFDANFADLELFEKAIDRLRIGLPIRLFEYFDVDEDNYPEIEFDFCLDNNNWQKQLHLLLYYYEQLSKTAFVPARAYLASEWQFDVLARLVNFKQNHAID